MSGIQLGSIDVEMIVVVEVFRMVDKIGMSCVINEWNIVFCAEILYEPQFAGPRFICEMIILRRDQYPQPGSFFAARRNDMIQALYFAFVYRNRTFSRYGVCAVRQNAGDRFADEPAMGKFIEGFEMIKQDPPPEGVEPVER